LTKKRRGENPNNQKGKAEVAFQKQKVPARTGTGNPKQHRI
jgi:hypothetical protein